MVGTLAHLWHEKFMETVQTHESSAILKVAALEGRLGKWTTALTQVVCATCESIGWKAAAKKNRSHVLPVSGEEYLALDVVAFEPAGDRRWRFPVAVIELENSRTDDRVRTRSGRFCVPALTSALFFATAEIRRKAPRSFGTYPSR
jgi:hypothetical protein